MGLSKGSQFKYLFDFGDEWRFQCKVLREEIEPMDIPRVVRRSGESPVQYPYFEEWDEEYFSEYNEEDSLENEKAEAIPPEQIERLYEAIPLDRPIVDCIHRYMDAAVRLYGIVSLQKAHEIYNSQNPPINEELFAMAAEVIDCEENPYFIVEVEDPQQKGTKGPLDGGTIIADYLFVEDPDEDISSLCSAQAGKPYKIFPREKFLKYADLSYYPSTPQRRAMIKYLLRKEKRLSLTAEDFCSCIQDLIVVDAPMQAVLAIIGAEGLVFYSPNDMEQFLSCYQELNNHTHKHANRGHTPREMFAMANRTKGKGYGTESGQMKLYDE